MFSTMQVNVAKVMWAVEGHSSCLVAVGGLRDRRAVAQVVAHSPQKQEVEGVDQVGTGEAGRVGMHPEVVVSHIQGVVGRRAPQAAS